MRQRGATPEVEARLRETIARLKKTIANKNQELAQLRADVPELVRAINVLVLENQQLREARDQAGSTVVPLRPKRPTGSIP